MCLKSVCKHMYNTCVCVLSLQNEIRSLVSLGDGAAGGGSSSAGPAAVVRGMGSSSGAGGSAAGESSSKRSGSGRAPTGSSRRKKENSSGPLLFDNAIEWWRREKVTDLFHLCYTESSLEITVM